MLNPYLLTAFYVSCGVISGLFYRHAGRPYAAGKSESIQGSENFSKVYPLLRWSTMVIAIAAAFSDTPLLLKIHDNTVTMLIGLMLASIGLAFFVLAKINLGEHYSPCFDSLLPRDIRTDGIYGYVRHPIYAGNILLLIGVFLTSASTWMLINVLVLTAFYYKAAREEEQALSDRFAAYRLYRARTGMFFPRLVKQPANDGAD